MRIKQNSQKRDGAACLRWRNNGDDSMNKIITGIVPLILLILLVAFFLSQGPVGVLKGFFPPVEKVFIERVTLEPNIIILDIINDGPDETTIAQVLVNNVYYKFDMESQTLKPLQSARITINYPWIRGNTERVTLLTSSGITFEKEIPVAVETPKISEQYITTFAMLGVYVGLIPVFLGLLWLPFLRTISGKWHNFLLSLTVGLLVFLGLEAFSEAIELIGQVPSVFNGSGLLIAGFFISLFVLIAISERSQRTDRKNKAITLSYLIALGIGLHNLGEGLAIGSAYAIGEFSLGTLLVVGFMIHNVTEGLAIVAPVAKQFSNWRGYIKHLILLGLLAGGPTIIGAWIGGFAYSASLALIFLAIGIGAIFQVVYELVKYISRDSFDSLFNATNSAGFIVGILILYITGLFVI